MDIQWLVFRTLSLGIFEVRLPLRDFLLALIVLVIDLFALGNLLLQLVPFLLVIKSRLVVFGAVLLQFKLLLYVVKVVLVHM